MRRHSLMRNLTFGFLETKPKGKWNDTEFHLMPHLSLFFQHLFLISSLSFSSFLLFSFNWPQIKLKKRREREKREEINCVKKNEWMCLLEKKWISVSIHFPAQFEKKESKQTGRAEMKVLIKLITGFAEMPPSLSFKH